MKSVATDKSNRASAREITLARAQKHLLPARIALLQSMGVDFVASRAEDYFVWDMDGRKFLDLDLRAGVYNLGHNNPIVKQALHDALEESKANMGFALFSGERQAELSEKLAKSAGMEFVILTPSGTEANDMAIRSARRQTNKRRIVSCAAGYHGATGLAAAAGNSQSANSFFSDYPSEFTSIALNDSDALARELAKGDVAAVLLEPVCNAVGYPSAPEGYWEEVRVLCDENECLLIVDEIVTGLGRSGYLWGFEKLGIKPDILVTGKGLSGGVYPVSAAIFSEKSATWLKEDFGGYAGTFGGGELASAVGNSAFDLSSATETLENVNRVSTYFRDALNAIAEKHPIIVGIRQFGALFALELDRDGAGLEMTGSLFHNGVLTFPPVNADRVINIKLGLLASCDFCDDALQRIEDAVSEL